MNLSLNLVKLESLNLKFDLYEFFEDLLFEIRLKKIMLKFDC